MRRRNNFSYIFMIIFFTFTQELQDFWPERGESVEVDCGNFKLSMREDPEEEDTGFTVREFILESIQYDYIFMTKVGLYF